MDHGQRTDDDLHHSSDATRDDPFAAPTSEVVISVTFLSAPSPRLLDTAKHTPKGMPIGPEVGKERLRGR